MVYSLRMRRRAISLFAAGLGTEAKQFADTALGGALPPEQQAQVRLSIASMFALVNLLVDVSYAIIDPRIGHE